MGLSLASLGSAAEGAVSGWQRGLRIREDNDQRAVERKRQAEADAIAKDMQTANQAAAERLNSFAPKADPTANYMTLGGSDSSMPDQSAIDRAPKAAPFRPTQEHLLRAAQARTDKLFELGRTDQAVQQWAKDEQLRGMMRKQAAERGMMSYKASGDPTELLKGVYGNLDDGWDISSVVPSKDADGSAVYEVERVNQLTGKVQKTPITAEKLESLIAFSLDPVQAAQYSLKEKLAAFEQAQKQGTERVKGEELRKTLGDRIEGNKDVAEIRAGATLGAANVRAKATTSAAATRAGASGGAGGGPRIQRTLVDSDGYVTGVFKDGTTKRLVIDGKPVRSGEWAKRVDSMANAMGRGLGGVGKTPAELRLAAEETMLGSESRATPPFAPAAKSGNKDFSALWK